LLPLLLLPLLPLLLLLLLLLRVQLRYGLYRSSREQPA
jgi:hypothetical protein